MNTLRSSKFHKKRGQTSKKTRAKKYYLQYKQESKSIGRSILKQENNNVKEKYNF